MVTQPPMPAGILDATGDSDDSSPITLINVFEVDPEHLDTFVAGWHERARIMQGKDGFISARLHRAISDRARFQLVNVARWASLSAYRAAFRDPEFQAQIQAVVVDKDIEVTSTPALYRVAVELSAE